MGLLDNFKQKQQQLQDLRDKVPLRYKATYYGGYQKYKKCDGTLTIYQDKVAFGGSGGLHISRFSIAKQDITELAVEGKDEVGKRITATRLLATGVLALAWQKKTETKTTFVTVTTSDGQEVVFQIEDKSHLELKPLILNKIGVVATPAAPAAQPQGSVADELAKLAQLREQGVITEDEFVARKFVLFGDNRPKS